MIKEGKGRFLWLRVYRLFKGRSQPYFPPSGPAFAGIMTEEKGQALLETALTLPLLLLLLAGIWQGTLLYRERLLVSYASFAGVRAGVVHAGAAEEPAIPARQAVGYVLGGALDPALGLGELPGRLETAVNVKDEEIELKLNYLRPLPLPWLGLAGQGRLPRWESVYRLRKEVFPQ